MKFVNVLFSFFIFHFSFFTPAYAGLTDFKTIKTAEVAYRAKDYNRTIRALSQLETPTPERNFDLGDAYYKAGRLDDALQIWKRAKGGSVDEEQRLHNIGNVYFKKRQYDHAITAYEAALKVHDDADTRFNLELAKKMKKKQAQKKKKKKQQKKKQEKKQPNKKQQKNKNKNTKNKNKNDKQKQNKKNNSDKKKSNKNQKKNPNDKQGKQPKKPSQKQSAKPDKPPKNKPGQKKGDKKSPGSAKPNPQGTKKKPEKAQGASRDQRAQKIRAKEIRRLMKQLKGKKMQPKLYQFVGNKRDRSKQHTINPW